MYAQSGITRRAVYKTKDLRCLAPNSRLRDRAKRFTRSLTLRASKVAPLAVFLSPDEARHGENGKGGDGDERKRDGERVYDERNVFPFFSRVSLRPRCFPACRLFASDVVSFSLCLTRAGLSPREHGRWGRESTQRSLSFCPSFRCFSADFLVVF